MTIAKAILLILTGTVGTFGFALLFRIRSRLIIWAVVGGCLTTALYALSLHFFTHEFFQNLLPALFATAYAEVLARLTKAPTTPYIACSIIPLVPGGALYYTMYHFVIGEMDVFHARLIETLRISAGLAVGIICVSAVVHLFNQRRYVLELGQKE